MESKSASLAKTNAPAVRRMAGNLYGTNTGRLFLEFQVQEGSEDILGVLRVNDERAGLMLFNVAGLFNGTQLIFSGTTSSATEGPDALSANMQSPIQIEAQFALNQNGSFGGRWQTDLGHAGTAELFPHDHLETKPTPAEETTIPKRLHQSSVQLGVIRLAMGDIRRLIELFQAELPSSTVVVTCGPTSKSAVMMAPEFLRTASNLGDVREIRIDAREMGPDGLTRSATVELGRFDKNEISASGGSDVWVTGVVHSAMDQIGPKQARWATLFRKHWGYVNLAVLFLLMVWLPGVQSVFDRLYIVLVAVVGMFSLLLTSTRFVPIAIVRLGTENPSIWYKTLPGLITSLITSLVVASAAAVLTAVDASGLLSDLLGWFQQVLPDELAPAPLPSSSP